MELIKETRLEGEFDGFDLDKVFTLASGQKYQQVRYKYRYHYSYRPKVKVFRDGGKYFLEIDGMNEIIEVRKI